MTRWAIRLVALAGFLMVGIGLQAHHAVAGVYDLNKEVVLEGRLKKLNFTNPHASIELDVPNKTTKKITTWVLTTASTQNLTRQGVTKSAMKPGELLKVTILPGEEREPGGIHQDICSLATRAFSFSSGMARD